MIFWVSSILKVNLDHFNGQNTPKNPGVDIKIVTLHDLAAKLFHFLILPVMADVGHLEFTVLLIFCFDAWPSSNPSMFVTSHSKMVLLSHFISCYIPH